ncbi:hypothetical protein BJX96DRAFT_20436 [Aspergillus floccosus]
MHLPHMGGQDTGASYICLQDWEAGAHHPTHSETIMLCWCDALSDRATSTRFARRYESRHFSGQFGRGSPRRRIQMLSQLLYRPTNVLLIDVRHDEVVPAEISTSSASHLVKLTQMEYSRVPLCPAFLRRIFPMPRRPWVGMKAGARTLVPQRVRS